MLNNVQVLDLSNELLVRVLARATHHRVGHLLGLHLLSNLTGSIVAAKKEDINKLETKNTEEVPADARHPSGIHLSGLNTSLEHALELDGNWERQFHDDISTKEGVNPAHDERVGNNHGHVVLHHAHHAIHGAGVGQRVGRRLSFAIRLLQVSSSLVVGCKNITSGFESFLRKDMVVGTKSYTTSKRALLAHGLLVLLFGRCRHKNGYIVTQDTSEDHDDGDGDKDPVE